MNFQEVTEQARGNIGPYCKACNVCNGAACKNQMPGPGAKGLGKVAMRNYEKWQEICVNMDTICEQKPVNTKVELFGSKSFRILLVFHNSFKLVYYTCNKGIACLIRYEAKVISMV